MIDWSSVCTNSLWAIGLAVVLAVFSQQDWHGSFRGESLWATIQHVAYNPRFSGGLSLACLGAGLSVGGWAERLLWFLLAALLVATTGWATCRRPGGT